LHQIAQDPLLRVEGLSKKFRSGEAELLLFENLSFQVEKGTMLAIVGQSGAGKSTLLHILAALDRPTAGAVYCANSHVNSLSEDDAAEFRNREIGYVWQFHYLLPEFTALENVAMPLLTRGQAINVASQEASAWLQKVGLENRGHHRAGELSGGEQQRLALARALIALCDWIRARWKRLNRNICHHDEETEKRQSKSRARELKLLDGVCMECLNAKRLQVFRH